jgi:putative ABC transport system permease protein
MQAAPYELRSPAASGYLRPSAQGASGAGSIVAAHEAGGARWWAPISIRLAWRNLVRDRVRLAISVVGVGFSVVLMAVQLGLLLGFALTSSSLVDHSAADFWITSKGTTDVDQTGELPYRARYNAEGIPGVASTANLIVGFAPWKTPGGATKSVIVVGIDPEHPALEPWRMVSGAPGNLRLPDGIIIDELYARKLGVSRVGQRIEVGERRARVVGLTSGVRTFTQSPYVFASFDTAARLAHVRADRTSYLLVRAKPGADLARLRNALESRFPYDDVWTKTGFSWQTRIYWLFTTGAGTALCIAAALGLVVGIVVVAQTLYAATVERIPEYATLRALGATDWYIRSVILCQALAIAVLGYAAGLACAGAIAFAARDASAALLLSWPLALALLAVTVLMCSSASLLSIRKVLAVDPATVFR